MNVLINELLKSKAHLGKKNWNHNTSPYILGFRPAQRVIKNSPSKIKLSTLSLNKMSDQRPALTTKDSGPFGLSRVKSVVSFPLKQKKLLKKRSLFAVFNLEKTLICLSQAVSFIHMLFKNSKLKNQHLQGSQNSGSKGTFGPHILIVGGKINNPSGSFHLDLFRIFSGLNLNIKPTLSFVQDKWVGGMLTNWKQVSESLRVYTQFKFKFENFLQKHLIHFPIYEKYNKRYSGLTQIGTSVPDLIIITNPEENEILIREAFILKIPVIAFTNSDLAKLLFAKIQYPIPGNNTSPQFVYFCLNILFTAMQFFPHSRA